MALIEQLELANFRSYAAGRFRFSSSRVVFTGPNGAGKTNLLESIYFLSILRSFRTVSGRELVRIGERGFELKARVDKGAYHEELRLAQTLAGKRETWIGANRIRRSSEFIREFRAVVFVPEDRNISGGSSSFRRRFFDMMISTLDGGYLTALNNYYRALSQRNRALKQKEQAAVAAAFEPEMAVNAPLIARQRRIYAKLIEEEVSRMLAEDGNLEFRIVCRTDYPENAAEYREMLERKYGREGARERIYATTDKARGALKGLADEEGYEEFVVPDDVGGRYSVLTAVGLLPIAVTGIDVGKLLAGAEEMRKVCEIQDFTNPAWRYAAARYRLYRAGRSVEVLSCYEPAFRFMGEWWKQLFGESEGKEGKGLFPASVEFTADLHSMGQYLQQGQRLMLETTVRFAPQAGSPRTGRMATASTSWRG